MMNTDCRLQFALCSCQRPCNISLQSSASVSMCVQRGNSNVSVWKPMNTYSLVSQMNTYSRARRGSVQSKSRQNKE